MIKQECLRWEKHGEIYTVILLTPIKSQFSPPIAQHFTVQLSR